MVNISSFLDDLLGMHRAFLVSLLFGILIFSTVANTNFVGADGALLSERNPKDVIINTDMHINLVMIGDTWSDADKESIPEKLLKTYAPTIFFEDRLAGVKYNYVYNFDSVSQQTATNLFKFIDK